MEAFKVKYDIRNPKNWAFPDDFCDFNIMKTAITKNNERLYAKAIANCQLEGTIHLNTDELYTLGLEDKINSIYLINNMLSKMNGTMKMSAGDAEIYAMVCKSLYNLREQRFSSLPTHQLEFYMDQKISDAEKSHQIAFKFNVCSADDLKLESFMLKQLKALHKIQVSASIDEFRRTNGQPTRQLSDCCTLRNNLKDGVHAATDIPVGMVVCTDKPMAATFDNPNMQCFNCHKITLIIYRCLICCGISYCSSACEAKDFALHKYECSAMHYKLLNSPRLGAIIRQVMPILLTFDKYYDSNDSKVFKDWSDAIQIILKKECDNPNLFLTYFTFPPKYKTIPLNTLTKLVESSATIGFYLAKNQHLQKLNVHRIGCINLALLIGAITLRIMAINLQKKMVFSFNIDTEFSPEKKIQRSQSDKELRMQKMQGIYPTISYFRHSCNPNIKVIYVPSSGKLVAKAVRPIKAGEAITLSYGVHFLTHKDDEIKTFLASHNLVCDCVGCQMKFNFYGDIASGLLCQHNLMKKVKQDDIGNDFYCDDCKVLKMKLDTKRVDSSDVSECKTYLEELMNILPELHQDVLVARRQYLLSLIKNNDECHTAQELRKLFADTCEITPEYSFKLYEYLFDLILIVKEFLKQTKSRYTLFDEIYTVGERIIAKFEEVCHFLDILMHPDLHTAYVVRSALRAGRDYIY